MAVNGINEAIAKIKRLGREAVLEMEAATQDASQNIALHAKNLAPTNFGKLGQSIEAVKVTFNSAISSYNAFIGTV